MHYAVPKNEQQPFISHFRWDMNLAAIWEAKNKRSQKLPFLAQPILGVVTKPSQYGLGIPLHPN